MNGLCREPSLFLNNQVEERVESPSRGPFRGSRSKAPPTRPSVFEPIGEGCVFLLPDRWEVPEEASSAQPFRA
jgi:hypothetical protein